MTPTESMLEALRYRVEEAHKEPDSLKRKKEVWASYVRLGKRLREIDAFPPGGITVLLGWSKDYWDVDGKGESL